MMKANGWSEYFTVIITLYKYTHYRKEEERKERTDGSYICCLG